MSNVTIKGFVKQNLNELVNNPEVQGETNTAYIRYREPHGSDVVR